MSDKLPNSGDILNFLRPSYSRKINSGWANNSCMVIFKKMRDSMADYRGSKSVISTVTVKEQRVDGFWQEKRNNGTPLPLNLFKLDKKRFNCLRCTLINLEINSVNRIRSKHINNLFSNQVGQIHSTKASFNLNSSFIRGFVDGEGCFSVTLVKDKTYKSG